MSRAVPAAAAFLGVVLAGAGVAVFWLTDRSQAAFGWTAYTGSYAPLPPTGSPAYRSRLTFGDGWTVMWTGGHLLGVGLVVLGLLVLAATAGWLAGVRTAGNPAD